jgi:hypothetical protein
VLEPELLLKISQGLPSAVTERYEELISRRRAGDLSPEELGELLDLTAEVERFQADRIEHLAELARLRCQPLRVVMDELGIRPAPEV